MRIYEFLTGPMMWTTVLIFAAGMLYKTGQIFYLVRSGRYPGIPLYNPNARFYKSFESSMPGRHPFTTLVSVVFHMALFAVPLFLNGHNIMLDAGIGISLPMMPDHIADNLTVIYLGCCMYFLLRRTLVRRVRALTFFKDYLILILVSMPFLTGFMAYHRLLSYDILLNCHIISGQLMLIAIPFTRLIHMVVFFLLRLPPGRKVSGGFTHDERVWS